MEATNELRALLLSLEVSGDESTSSRELSITSSAPDVFPLDLDEGTATSSDSHQLAVMKPNPAVSMVKATALQAAANSIHKISAVEASAELAARLKNTEDLDPKLVGYFTSIQNMLLEINRVLSRDLTDFPEETTQKTINLAKAISHFFGALQDQYRDQIARISEVEKQLPALHDKMEKKFLFHALKTWAENIIPNTKKPTRAEHVILACFSSLNNEVVYKPSLVLRQTVHGRDLTVYRHLDYAYHAIEKALELYTVIVGNMIFFKGQMQPVVTRMMNSPELKKDLLNFTKLRERLDREAAASQGPTMITVAPVSGLDSFGEESLVIGDVGDQSGMVGTVMGGVLKENVSLKQGGSAPKGV